MNELHNAFSRLPPLLRACLAVWLILGFIFGSFDELHANMPWWVGLVFVLPYVALVVYLGISADILGVKAVTSKAPDASSPEDDPVALYEAGRISHPEMMARIRQRNLSDMLGCRTILFVAMVGFFLVVMAFPGNPDGSVKADVLAPAFAIVALAAGFTLARRPRNRAVRWAASASLAVAMIGLPLTIIEILQR